MPATAVGGDLYDFVQVSADHLLILIGDVSGKGVPAALMMAKVISDFRAAAHRAGAPAAILGDLNAELVRQSPRGMFVTATCLVLDAARGRVDYASAGHLPPLWYRHRARAVEPCDGDGGPPLGILLGIEYPVHPLDLAPSDALLLYTDGVVEARGMGSAPYGLGRLMQAMGARLPAAASLVEDILGDVRAHAAGLAPHDDLTLVALRWRPAP